MAERLHFLIAGVQKGGTTALFEHLRAHPGIELPTALKEAHFFDDEGVDWTRPDYARYHALFAGAPGKARGEATPIYTYWPNSLERIAAYNPQIKLIVLFREPALRAWSHWRMEVSRGFDDRPFGWGIREGRARVGGHHRVYSYVERGFYAAQVERLLGLFPREKLLFLRSNDLKADPARTLGGVCTFLDVSALPVAAPLYANVSADRVHGDRPPPDDLAYLRALYADDQARFERLTGLALT